MNFFLLIGRDGREVHVALSHSHTDSRPGGKPSQLDRSFQGRAAVQSV